MSMKLHGLTMLHYETIPSLGYNYMNNENLLFINFLN